MHAKVEAATAEDCEAEGSQATEGAYNTSIEVLETRLQCGANTKRCAKDQHRRVRKTKMKVS